jgi:hypothetical protein
MCLMDSRSFVVTNSRFAQLCGARGIDGQTSGEIIERPICVLLPRRTKRAGIRQFSPRARKGPFRYGLLRPPMLVYMTRKLCDVRECCDCNLSR